MSLSPELRDLLTLSLVPGLGPRLTAALLQRFGSAGAALRATTAQLQAIPHIGPKLAGQLADAMRRQDVEAELELIARHHVGLLARGREGYPRSLDDIPDPPWLLYARGSWLEADARAVALVGSRHCTPYGLRLAKRLAADLARAGFTVVSGLARGIDAAAHRGALEARGRTIAVLAGGLSRIYPPEHEDLARQVEASGALLSEAAMSASPMAGMFPARNRLISGLSRGVVVIEAAERSGALITARHAAEQGRLVFAVPGPVDSATSSGTLALLRDGATLVRGAEDILEELEGVRSARPRTRPEAVPPGLDDIQLCLWQALGDQPKAIDVLVQQTGLAVAQATGTLLMLEMKKLARRLPGNQYVRA